MRLASRWLLVLASVLAGTLLHAADPPSLYRIERKNADDLTVLRSSGIPIVQETRFSLFVLGDHADQEALAKRGYDATLLDDQTANADYLMVGLRPDSDVDAIRAAGAVLFAEENWLLLRIPAGMDVEVIHEARAWVARIPEQPVAVPKPAPAAESQRAVLIANPIVQKVLATVTDASIQAYWQAIVSNPPTGTRYSTSQGCRDAATYCFNAYTGLKLQAQNQNWNASNAPNVIGTHTGATRPEDVYIFVAHLDDLPSSGTAPGADDNGSGSAAVLQAAKALSCWGARNTVKFLNVTGEEQGLNGSEAYVADAVTRGENILGVINHDMIGWAGNNVPVGENLDLNYNAPSQWLAQRFVDAAATYATGLAVDAFLCPALTASDHAPFWLEGFSAVCGITDNEGYCGHTGNYPHYHMSTDTIANNGNPAFYYKVVKTTVATMAELADPFKITFGAGAYACGTAAQVLVADRDLNTSALTAQSVLVHVWSASEAAGETMTLTERGPNSMIFDGSITTAPGPAVSGDGLLSVSDGETLHVEYVDALDCDGTTGVTYAATIPFDAASHCGPHAAYGSQGNIGDVCSFGGPGNGNGTWDPGESVQFKVGVANDGTEPLSEISGMLTSSTPGIAITDGAADFPGVAAGASVESLAPHFTVTLPQNLACGSQVAFGLTIASAQGSWNSAFTRGIGTILPGGGTVLDEHFTSGIPATWTVVNGGTGSGTAATWTTANPGSRTFASPLVAPVAIVDSDAAGPGEIQDEQLITPVMNLAAATSVTLQFDQYFRWFSGGLNEIGDVDVRSSATGGVWANVFRNQNASSANPDHRTLNITAQAAGAADVQVRFHYYQTNFDWWWQVDNVSVTYTSPGGCAMNVCLAPPSAPPPVPDGSFGTAMTATRAAADGSSIDLGWDGSSCTAAGYKLLHGSLSSVSSHAIGGSACALGTSGSANWSSVPPGDLWYAVVATDGAGTEGSWGNASAGPRGGATPSTQCGDGARSNAGTCP